MRQPLRARLGHAFAAVGLLAALVLPGVGATSAADEARTLKIGLLQSLDSMNPYGTALFVGYEAFELSFDQLVGFGPEIDPYPAFAASWERAADKKSWTFKFRPDMKWSDGTPATSEDACFSWQLALDAIAAESYIGLGYLDPALKNAGVTKVECPDPLTMIAYSEDNSSRILQSYLPIIPKHIWGDYTYETIGEDALFEPPADGSGLIGSGPYQAVEWRTGEFARFAQNPNYWGSKGYEEEIIFQFFDSADTMVQALKAGEIDYARTINSDQFDALATETDIVTVNGASNGWTELGFNTYGTGTGSAIEGGGPSTTALQDSAFRDALGYAIDKQQMVDTILGGYGVVGSTQVPPVLKNWHVDPANPRSFDLEVARQKLDAAGYPLDAAAGTRIDREGKPINLRLVLPDSDANLDTAAQFIVDWFGQVGIKVTARVYDEDTLIDLMLPPEAGDEKYKADFDLFIWTWSWGPDPSDALQIFTCDQIGSSSDSLWCNADYDAMYQEQLVAPDDAARLEILDRMQQLFYDEAPYHVLYYDDALHAYRTDKFGGWQNQPSNGTPFFTYSVLGETLLTAPVAEATPTPAAPAEGSAGPTASSEPAVDPGSAASVSTPLIVGVVLLVVVVGGGVVLFRRRQGPVDEE